MVQRMMRRPVDDMFKRMTSDHVRVVDEDSPDVDENEHGEIEVSLHGEKEDEGVIGRSLRASVKRMEGMRREGCRNCLK